MKSSRYILPTIFILISLAIQFGPRWTTNSHSDSSEPIVSACIEQQIQLTDTNRLTTRNWVTFSNYRTYCGNYTSSEIQYAEAKDFRDNYFNIWYTSNGERWGMLYESMFEREKDLLLPLIDTLLTIKQANRLNRTDFANVVVAFVQDIPYCYIKSENDCDVREYKEFDCLAGQKWGLLSPIEFLHTLKGDCDTRTLLLYSLFKQLGYSPKIVNSDVYLHSMLLLDIPSGGKYLTYNNERFYFWETTAKGWQAGDLPPEYGNTKYWEIVLS